MATSIAILAPSGVPFQTGGAEKLWWGLRQALHELPGCQAELLKLPAPERDFPSLLGSYEQFSQLDLAHFDLLISTKYPAWMARHARHICYMQHTLRGLYDTYKFTGLPERVGAAPEALRPLLELIRGQQPARAALPEVFALCRRALAAKNIPSSFFAFPGPLCREVIHFLDAAALAPGEICAYLAISQTVAVRPGYFPAGVPVQVLHHPSDICDFFCADGEYFFTASRLNATKRVHLIVEAMRLSPLQIQLKIAGDGPELAHLRDLAGGDPRIEFLGHVPDAGLTDLYANALAVIFTPYDEDYGLITLEAFKSGKPVLTANDCGGVLELVRHGENGLVTEPNPGALAKAMRRLAADPAWAAQLGAKGRQIVSHIQWNSTAQTLLAAAAPDRPQILVAAPFMADAHGHGGQRRLYHFCAALAETCIVKLVCMGAKDQAQNMFRELAPRLAQLSLPWPEAILESAARLADKSGHSADDIALLRGAAQNAAITQALRDAARNASAAVLSHPWFYPAVAAVAPGLPLVYDAHNVEAELKRGWLEDNEICAEVAKAEGALARKAGLICACSEDDMTTLEQLYGIRRAAMRLLPNGCVQPPQGAGADLRSRLAYPDSRLALFIGSGHKPNLDAALAIFGMARQQPQTQFILAGTVSTQKQIRETPRPRNVHLAGAVSEKVKNILLMAADIALNPVVSGSGTNLKSVEYLAFGKNIVSTPCGMRGIPPRLAQAAHVCELEHFPAAIRQRMDDPPPAAVLAAAAHTASQMFAWKNVMAPLCPALAAMLRGQPCA